VVRSSEGARELWMSTNWEGTPSPSEGGQEFRGERFRSRASMPNSMDISLMGVRPVFARFLVMGARNRHGDAQDRAGRVPEKIRALRPG